MAEDRRSRDDAVRDLQDALGWSFRRSELLEQALRHSSAAYEGGTASNERLEFLGDAALSHAVALLLYTRWPDAREGELTRGRAFLVRERTLVELGTRLGVPEVLELGGGLRPGQAGAAVLADATEAILGAVLLDGGWKVFRPMVTRLFAPFLAELSPEQLPLEEPKSTLQEMAQRDGLALPVYREVAVHGPAHERRYVYEVEFDGRVLARGEGSSKRAAQQEAARAALEAMGVGSSSRPSG